MSAPVPHSQNGAPASIRLPSRGTNHQHEPSNKPPVWAIDATASDAPPAPLPAKCARHVEGRAGVCCKELKGDDERELIDPDVVRDIVIGLSDGLTVPFALTAGLSSLGESRLVVLGGIAELIAGALSMGIGGFLASQAERDHFRHLRRVTRARVLRSCDGEMEREVHAVLGTVGVEETASRAVARSLLAIELGEAATRPSTASSSASRRSDDEEGQSSGLRWSDDVGITAFLLKFGEGLEEVPTRRLYVSAVTIGLGYLLGGIIPLIPYFFVARARVALLYSSILTGATLFVFGLVKSHVTGAAHSPGQYAWGALSTMLVGGAAAAAAFAIVAALEPKA
ncbi:membrane fraction protein [Vararia minispora EC-137]|uniref:Membrane fraction protein n=1 Tax=Vararia minispora EC-137 TaxID=1314806 RepID=A0ACB8QYP4_9AGAM|nr:membrane fraction protein [Vararia minispora EC-137]